LPAELEAAPPEDAAQAMADYFATARAPDSVNLLEAPVEDGEDQGEDNGELSEDRYSSLLAMGHPSVDARATFPAEDRAFDPPGDTTETAPAPAPHTVDTDAALRAALATLQRMSGAA
jgi:hypothetical protein